MKQTIVILLALLIIQSCSDSTQDEFTRDSNLEIAESHLDDIYTAVELYENSFIEVLTKETKLKSANSLVEDKSEQVLSLFQEKLDDTFTSPLVLKSTSIGTDTIDSNMLQSYMDEMAERLLGVDIDSVLLSQEEVIGLMIEQRDIFLEDLANDENLADWEKTIITENALLSSEMIFVTLKYGEDFEEIQLKGLRSWFKKNKKKIECTIKSATAVATCASVVAGNWIAWLKCASATAAAVNCWAQI